MTVQDQMYCILTKYTVADQILKFSGGHTFLGGFTAASKNSPNPDIRRRLGRLRFNDDIRHTGWVKKTGPQTHHYNFVNS